MARLDRFDGMTVEFLVPDFPAAVAFYTRLFGWRSDFEPYDDFIEWELLPKCWLQIGVGEPQPGRPLRLCVDDIEAEVARVARDLRVRCSPITRIPGLVAFCDFCDPWGNNLGFYQRLFMDGVPRFPGGRSADDRSWVNSS